MNNRLILHPRRSKPEAIESIQKKIKGNHPWYWRSSNLHEPPKKYSSFIKSADISHCMTPTRTVLAWIWSPCCHRVQAFVAYTVVGASVEVQREFFENTHYLTKHLTIYEPQDPAINEFRVVRIHWFPDSEALKLWNVRSGSTLSFTETSTINPTDPFII